MLDIKQKTNVDIHNNLPLVFVRQRVDESSIIAWAKNIAQQIHFSVFIALEGCLGSGKSTFARAFLRTISGEIDIPSPTFAIVHQYCHKKYALPIIHADLYRITHPKEIEELGLTEMLLSSIALVEWPDRLSNAFYPSYCWKIKLDINIDENYRDISWIVPNNTIIPQILIADWHQIHISNVK